MATSAIIYVAKKRLCLKTALKPAYAIAVPALAGRPKPPLTERFWPHLLRKTRLYQAWPKEWEVLCAALPGFPG